MKRKFQKYTRRFEIKPKLAWRKQGSGEGEFQTVTKRERRRRRRKRKKIYLKLSSFFLALQLRLEKDKFFSLHALRREGERENDTQYKIFSEYFIHRANLSRLLICTKTA
jgi:hypothetical protein